jgi:hypothetical protein
MGLAILTDWSQILLLNWAEDAVFPIGTFLSTVKFMNHLSACRTAAIVLSLGSVSAARASDDPFRFFLF